MKRSQDVRNRFKVLILETGGWGGIWHYSCCLGNALRDENVDFFTVTSKGFEEPFDLKFRILPLLDHTRGYMANLRYLYKTVATVRPSVVHLQSCLSARRDWIHVLVSRAINLPVIVTAHNLLPHDMDERHAPFMSWAFWVMYKAADAVIVHSNANKQKLSEAFHVPEKKIILIKHGNYRFFAEKHRVDPFAARLEYLGPNANRRTFLIFGTMRHYKGVDLALKAMSSLSRLNDMHLIVAGKPFGEVLDVCKALARGLNILDHVTFLPGYFHDQEVAKIHAAADICVFPYREIFQSGSLQTALAFGKPIIAASIGSFPETVNSTNAWLVKPDSADSLAQALEKALGATDKDLITMAKESLRISIEEHDWKEIAKKTKAVYLSLR
jgi:glycosyltransferase involved in cell wall biosynthesis